MGRIAHRIVACLDQMVNGHARLYQKGHALRSYNVEMRKHTLRGRLFAATVGKKLNNRLAVFRW
jgi:hypothetical protein